MQKVKFIWAKTNPISNVANLNIGQRLAKQSWIYLSNLDINSTPSDIIDVLDGQYKNLYRFGNPTRSTFKLGDRGTL